MKKMTIEAASRIYKATAKKTGGTIPPNSFAAKAMKSAMKNFPVKPSKTK